MKGRVVGFVWGDLPAPGVCLGIQADVMTASGEVQSEPGDFPLDCGEHVKTMSAKRGASQ
jgi:hypothetical protein